MEAGFTGDYRELLGLKGGWALRECRLRSFSIILEHKGEQVGDSWPSVGM